MKVQSAMYVGKQKSWKGNFASEINTFTQYRNLRKYEYALSVMVDSFLWRYVGKPIPDAVGINIKRFWDKSSRTICSAKHALPRTRYRCCAPLRLRGAQVQLQKAHVQNSRAMGPWQ